MSRNTKARNVALRLTDVEDEALLAIAEDLVVSPAWITARALRQLLGNIAAGNDLAEALTPDTIELIESNW